MDLALAGFSLVPGLAIGSFLNVVAARVPLRRSLVRPGSSCGACGALIAWYDNVPLASFAILRGRCRGCASSISWKYPLVELSTAVLVAASVLTFGLTAQAAVAACFCCVLVAVSVIDLEHRIIPNRIVLPAAIVLLAAQTLRAPSPEWTLAALAASGFLLAAALAYPAGMGMGDVKFALLLGAVLGRNVTVAMALALLTAMVPSIFLLARHGRAGRKMGVPFGPFLALGGVVALFFGAPILDAYLRAY